MRGHNGFLFNLLYTSTIEKKNDQRINDKKGLMKKSKDGIFSKEES